MKNSKPLTIVIKLGTSSIVDEESHEPLLSILSLYVETAVKLRQDGYRVVLVSSGAIGIALRTMGYEKRPKSLAQVQALAAIGQSQLMSLWERLFNYRHQHVAQVLLTRNDIADRTQYINAQNTFSELLKMGVIPVVNENDTLAVTEIKFGDNDTLSAITAAMVQADYLFLMTDVECLYTTNPRTHSDAQPIEVVSEISALNVDVSSAGSSLGSGGMSTKIVAARLATAVGVTTVITHSSKPANVFDIVAYLEAQKAGQAVASVGITSAAPVIGESAMGTSLSTAATAVNSPPFESGHGATLPLLPPLHTRFVPSATPIRDRSFWLLHGLQAHGTVYIDAGAYRALRRKFGLLPAGVIDVEGTFNQHEAVRLVVVPRLHDWKDDLERSRTPSPGEKSLRSTPGTPNGAPANGGLGGHEGDFEELEDGATSSLASSGILNSQPTTPGRAASGSCTPSATKLSRSLRNSRQSSTIALAQHPKAKEVGRALVIYSSTEITRIKGRQSSEISGLLGYAESDYVALRENVILVDGTEADRGIGTDFKLG